MRLNINGLSNKNLIQMTPTIMNLTWIGFHFNTILVNEFVPNLITQICKFYYTHKYP